MKFRSSRCWGAPSRSPIYRAKASTRFSRSSTGDNQPSSLFAVSSPRPQIKKVCSTWSWYSTISCPRDAKQHVSSMSFDIVLKDMEVRRINSRVSKANLHRPRLREISHRRGPPLKRSSREFGLKYSAFDGSVKVRFAYSAVYPAHFHILQDDVEAH